MRESFSTRRSSSHHPPFWRLLLFSHRLPYSPRRRCSRRWRSQELKKLCLSLTDRRRRWAGATGCRWRRERAALCRRSSSSQTACRTMHCHPSSANAPRQWTASRTMSRRATRCHPLRRWAAVDTAVTTVQSTTRWLRPATAAPTRITPACRLHREEDLSDRPGHEDPTKI